MLDLNNWAWENETQPPSLPYDICNNVCDGIESVPYHKVFSFGGKKGMMQYSNSVEVGGSWLGMDARGVGDHLRVNSLDRKRSMIHIVCFGDPGPLMSRADVAISIGETI